MTVKPPVEAWASPKEAQRTRTPDLILAFVGRQKVRIENGRLIKDDPRVRLDFNSIAKGYTVDLLAQAVRIVRRQELHRRHRRRSPPQGRQPAGNSRGASASRPKFDGNMSNGEYLQRRIGMTEGGLATSGNYRRFYLDAKGNKIAHTIDPARGAPPFRACCR